MSYIIVFVLLCYGISNIIIYGSMFEWFRFMLSKLGSGPMSLYKLFNCMMCLPTWVGFIISILFWFYGVHHLTPMGIYQIDNTYVHIFLDGVFTSGCVWLIHTFQEYLEK